MKNHSSSEASLWIINKSVLFSSFQNPLKKIPTVSRSFYKNRDPKSVKRQFSAYLFAHSKSNETKG